MSIAAAIADDSVDKVREYPYQKICLKEQVIKIDKLSAKLNKKLNDVIHLYVHDTTTVNAGSTREPFPLKLKPTTPTGDIRDMIEDRYLALGLHDKSVEGPLRLVYGGETLVDGKRLCDYAVEKRRNTWSTPYAGINIIIRMFRNK